MKYYKGGSEAAMLQKERYTNHKVYTIPMADVCEASIPSNMQNIIMYEGSNGREMVNVTSSRYSLTHIKDIIEPIEQKLTANNIDWDVAYNRHSRLHQYQVVYRLTSIVVPITENDTVNPQIVVKHSYDGKVSYGIQMAAYRLICSNMLTLPYKNTEVFNLTSKHISLASNEINRHVDILLRVITQEFDNQINVFKVMADSMLDNWEDRMSEVIAATKYPTKLVDIAKARFVYEQSCGLSPSDYLLYNALNYALYNNDDNKTPEMRSKLDGKVLAYIQ